MLRVQVSRLRKALADGNGDGQPRLLARPPGYLLRVADGELDLHVFDHQAASGRQALADGDPDRAAALLREAESLWRGRPLADLESEPFAGLEVHRLEALRIEAVEDRIEAELALGRHTALCSELEQLVAEHPLRERLRGQLMLALYRSGRQADALESYRAVRSLLVQELAVEPGPQLRKLQLAILEQDPALDLPPPAARQDARQALRPRLAPDVRLVDRAWRRTRPPLPGPARERPRPRPRRRTRRTRLALGAAAALAALALRAPVPPRNRADAAERQPPRAGLGQRRRGAGDRAAAGATGRAWRRQPGPCGWPNRALAWWSASTRYGARSTATIPVGTAQPHHSRRRPGLGARPGRPHRGPDRPADRHGGADDRPGRSAQRHPAQRRVSLWVSEQGHGTCPADRPRHRPHQEHDPHRREPGGLAAADGAVWVATDDSGTAGADRRPDRHLTSRIRIGDAPAAVVAGAAGLWVLDPLDATVSRVDPRRQAVTATIALGGAPAAMVQSGGGVWIGGPADGTLLRLAPRHDMVTRFRLGGHVSALAAAGGDLWAAIDAAGPSHRGGTLTTIDTSTRPSTPSTRPPAPRTTCPRHSSSA